MLDSPSRTALRVALRRAAHQLFDAPPLVFEDPVAVRILGPYAAELHRTPGEGRRPSTRDRTYSRSLRAYLVARSRYAEDQLAGAVARGVRQYVLLGAGLDTFAHRNPHPQLAVLEIDHPATQAWKRELLAGAKLPHPAQLTYLPVDFERQSLAQCLGASSFRSQEPALFAWLGVVPYLTVEAFRATVAAVAQLAPGATLVFDYAMPREALNPGEQRAHDSLAERVRAAGEPFQLFFTPEQIRTELATLGLPIGEDLSGEQLNARYFAGRSDGLRLFSSAGHLVTAHGA